MHARMNACAHTLTLANTHTPTPPRLSLFAVSVRPTMTPSWLGAPFSTLGRQCRSLAIYKQTCWQPDLTEVFEVLTKCTVRRYGQVETSPETIEQELRPAVCETDRFKENYSIDVSIIMYHLLCHFIVVEI